MAYHRHGLEFIWCPPFEKAAKVLFSESDIIALEFALRSDPKAGDVIPGAAGLRKLRLPLKGRGERGGARVIYYFRSADNRIYLLYAYAKNTVSDVTTDQLRRFISIIQGDPS